MITFKKRSLLCLTLSLIFCFAMQAKAQRIAPTLADKREIIKIILEGKFSYSTDKTIKISTKNLPVEIRSNFPKIKNLRVQFVSESSEDSNVCPYEFGEFSVDGKYVSVGFSDCNDGLLYDFKKIRGKWKGVPYVIEK